MWFYGGTGGPCRSPFLLCRQDSGPSVPGGARTRVAWGITFLLFLDPVIVLFTPTLGASRFVFSSDAG